MAARKVIGMWVLGLCFVVMLSASSRTYAHQIESNNGVTALLHVNPDDEPFSGTTTSFYLSVSAPKEFSKELCDCTVRVAPYSRLDTIAMNGDTIDGISDGERVYGNTYAFAYIFPRHDMYALVFEGKPKADAQFEAFNITYTLRVARGEELPIQREDVGVSPVFPSLPYMCGILATLFLSGGWFYISRIRKK